MSSGRKLKNSSANFVARLMGFKAMPYQQLAHTQCQELPDKETPYQETFVKKHSKEVEVCKDVFVDHGTIKPEKVIPVSTESSGSERNFYSGRYMNRQRHSVDKRMHRRVKIGDPPSVVDSNKEIFVRILQNPNPLLTKHLYGLQSCDPQARCFHMTARNTMRAPLSELKDARRKSNRKQGSFCKHYMGPQSFCTTQNSNTGKQDILKHSTSWSESEYEISTFPRQIIVLKPNHRRSERKHTTKYDLPPHSYVASDSDYQAEKINDSKYSHIDQCRRKIYRHQEVNFEEPRKNPRKKTRVGRIAALGFLPKKSAGYAGDESSFYSSEGELKDVLTSRDSVDSSDQQWSSLSHSTDSPLTMKHKICFSEHCDTLGQYKKPGSSKRITLGEIMSFQDKEDRAGTLDSRIDGLGTDKYVHGYGGNGDCMCPQGSGTMDDWKAEYLRDSSRNKCVSGPSAALGVSKSRMQHKILEDASGMWTIETARLCSNASHVDIRENETVPVRNEKFRRNSHSSKISNSENGDHSTKVLVSQNQQKHTDSNTYTVDAGSSTLDRVGGNAHPISAERHVPLEEVRKEDVNTCLLEMLIFQETSIHQTEDSVAPTTNPVLGPNSAVSSDEVEQPSPVSVLDFPNVDASSSVSDCFGRVSADLQGLRAQVRMLKLELAQDEEEEPDLPQTNGNTGQDTVSNSEEKRLSSDEISDSSYVADVLAESSFENDDPSNFLVSWYLPNVPMELSVFEKLEKKYGETAALPRSERRLLFDRINSGLVEIINQYTNPCAWGESITRRHVPVSKNALKDNLYKLLVGQEKKEDNRDSELQEVVVSLDGSEWLNLWENIYEICREVEETLLDELIAQVSEVM